MRQGLIRPKPLSTGSTLGVIATSTPIDSAGQALVERGYRRLREKGFKLVEASNCRQIVGHTAGSATERADVLHEFFVDPYIDGIIAFWGGLHSHQLLEYLDWNLIATNPKVLVGYSDLTCVTTTITDRTGLVTFSGPAVVTFAKPILFDYSWRWFERVLMLGGTELRYEEATICSTNLWYEEDDKAMIERSSPGWRCYQPGTAEGSVMGGNLGTLLLLAGTPYWPDLEGCILLVEEDEVESPSTIDQMFTQARQMGVFDKICGMIVGRFPESVRFVNGDSLSMILDDALKGYDFPVMVDVDIGHTDPLLTVPLGVRVRIVAEDGVLELIEPWLAP